MLLHKDVEGITVCVNGAPQPLFLAVDWNDDFIKVPLTAPQSLPDGLSYDSNENEDLIVRFGYDDIITFTDLDAMTFI